MSPKYRELFLGDKTADRRNVREALLEERIRLLLQSAQALALEEIDGSGHDLPGHVVGAPAGKSVWIEQDHGVTLHRTNRRADSAA